MTFYTSYFPNDGQNGIGQTRATNGKDNKFE
jgi:hypothetical protein